MKINPILVGPRSLNRSLEFVKIHMRIGKVGPETVNFLKLLKKVPMRVCASHTEGSLSNIYVLVSKIFLMVGRI